MVALCYGKLQQNKGSPLWQIMVVGGRKQLQMALFSHKMCLSLTSSGCRQLGSVERKQGASWSQFVLYECKINVLLVSTSNIHVHVPWSWQPSLPPPTPLHQPNLVIDAAPCPSFFSTNQWAPSSSSSTQPPLNSPPPPGTPSPYPSMPPPLPTSASPCMIL